MLVEGDVQIHGEGGPQANKEVLLGTVRFVGEAAFAPGEWLGLELDRQVGKNNGSVKGRTYFKCEPVPWLTLEVRPALHTAVVTKFSESADARSAHGRLSLQNPNRRQEHPSTSISGRRCSPWRRSFAETCLMRCRRIRSECFRMRWLRQRCACHQPDNVSL